MQSVNVYQLKHQTFWNLAKKMDVALNSTATLPAKQKIEHSIVL